MSVRRRYSESAASSPINAANAGGIDVVFMRRASSVRVRKPTYSYLLKPCTHDDGLTSGKVLELV